MKKNTAEEMFDLKAARQYVQAVKRKMEMEREAAKKAVEERKTEERKTNQKLTQSVRTSIPEHFSTAWSLLIRRAIREGSAVARIVLIAVEGEEHNIDKRHRALAKEGARFLRKKGFKVEIVFHTSPPKYGITSTANLMVSGW